MVAILQPSSDSFFQRGRFFDANGYCSGRWSALAHLEPSRTDTSSTRSRPELGACGRVQFPFTFGG
jgi:hypothetical protein